MTHAEQLAKILTKRELFAAMAMQGALGGTPGGHLRPDTLAADSVAHADALLAALNSTLPDKGKP